MPEGLSTDSNFQGYVGVNVLYITGNLYDMTIIKQVAVLGDSDDVTRGCSRASEEQPGRRDHDRYRQQYRRQYR